MPKKLKIWLALLTVYIFWGGTYLFIHFAVETIPPFFMAGSRFLIAGAILYIWIRFVHFPPLIRVYEERLARQRYFQRTKTSHPETTIRTRPATAKPKRRRR